MQELAITPATVVLLAIIALCLVWAVRRLVLKGLCDCHDHGSEGGCSACKSAQASDGCHGCSSQKK